MKNFIIILVVVFVSFIFFGNSTKITAQSSPLINIADDSLGYVSGENLVVDGQITPYNWDIKDIQYKLDDSADYVNCTNTKTDTYNINGVTPDLNFAHGVYNGFLSKQWISVNSMIKQPNGKILVRGGFSFYNGERHLKLIRLNQDGSVDDSFNIGTGPNAPYSISPLPNNKLLITGSFTSFNGTAVSNIARLNEDGSLDETFNIGSGPSSGVSATLLPNNQIIITGSFTSFNGTAISYIARLNEDGSLDNTFNPILEIDNSSSYPYDIRVVPMQDGSIVVLGDFISINSEPVSNVVKLSPNGSIDNTFNVTIPIEFTSAYSYLWLQSLPEDKLLIADSTKLYKLLSNGSADPEFSVDYLFNYIQTITLQLDGKILVADNGLVRLNSDGSYDSSFDTSGNVYSDMYVNSIAVQPDGKILVAFYSYTYGDKIITRFNIDGSPDLTFTSHSAFVNNELHAAPPYATGHELLLLDNNKILLGGDFVSYDGRYIGGMVKLNGDGSVDGSFYPSNTIGNPINGIFQQPSGKFLLINDGGINFNGVNLPRIIRVNADGSLDNSFSYPSFEVKNQINGFAMQSDGKILITGNFQASAESPVITILRLNPNGDIDNSFIFEGSGSVNKVLVTPDQKIYILLNNNIVKLNTDGSIDTNFVFNLSNELVVSEFLNLSSGDLFVSIEPAQLIKINQIGEIDQNFNINMNLVMAKSLVETKDGGIILAGLFKVVADFQDFSDLYNLIKINPDGSLDEDFVLNPIMSTLISTIDPEIINDPYKFFVLPALGIFNIANQVLLLPEDKLLVSAVIVTMNGTEPVFSFSRLNSDGTFDSSFPQFEQPLNWLSENSYVANSSVNQFLISNDGSLILAGSFNSYADTNLAYLLKLNLPAKLSNFSCSVPIGDLADGNHSIMIRAIDDYNVVSENKVVTFTLDTAAAAPNLSLIGGKSIVNLNTVEFLGTSPEVKGTAEPNSKIVFELGERLFITYANANGEWSLTLANLSRGENVFKYYIVDPFGNVSANSSVSIFIKLATTYTSNNSINNVTDPTPTISPTETPTITPTLEAPDITKGELNAIKIKFLNESGDLLVNAKITIENKVYYTNEKGEISAYLIPNKEYKININYEGQDYQINQKILGNQNSILVRTEEELDSSTLIFGVIVLVIFLTGLALFIKRKK